MSGFDFDVMDPTPVNLSDLTPDQLSNLKHFLIYASLPGEEAEHMVLLMLRELLHAPRARHWLEQRAQEVDDELQRQEEVLDAADLILAGGHRPSVGHDSAAADGEQWTAFCDCAPDGLGNFPFEEYARRALDEHVRQVEGGRS